ncbi:MAG: bifunctional methylenetetrahydrofolate dehydrogenase/methenyltetrahydrofolate cyclohydrolase FolD [Flavobacteriales bacterium]|jgi:methylenetetrahydrofolate dehydrogenase (NADP+) / methenyltetrahydrofolate cyclohydrolase|nr:bifunctional methylenetetrahydrofolate dehydrogenase/methenyltetrahydrofolate cyclohydrolase FolD [Flavobacteriales bacterium]MBT3964736.1 bifunctional methylenetetrahydrofolate dehydrogenase/methenyltetrahydrofolate cyclohydrolase FolD [Flavobacteriales bacterium]MBT4704719.1 bifunctional methylenetetrahydrofolate dehydrogenase/methenyltetrahydrofolate cyclohydrolase FolD [Flavobacteriales bacterium]MBT4931698.1 bifunctional methylenetetrahydrofolate dehydrogenase/methenyltetrahydrofolate cy
MELIDGKAISLTLREELRIEVEEMVKGGHRPPHLAVILVGENPASQAYVGAKVKACEKAGFKSSSLHFEPTISQDDLLKAIQTLNDDDELDGFIIQLPLPDHIDENAVIETVDPTKDVDGFHPINVGRMAIGLDSFISATPGGIVEMMRRMNIETEGKHCVILGRSNIVGAPMAMLMRRKGHPGNCTVTVAHSRTKDIKSITTQADILIAAIGIPEYVKPDMVKEGAVVIDVGINRVEDASRERGYRLTGDVAFGEVSPKCSYITPVPGGVGPMTIAYLLNNTMIAARKRM